MHNVNNPNYKYQSAPYSYNILKNVAWYDQEVFKPLPLLPHFYLVSNFGRVYSLRRHCLLVPSYDTSGYHRTTCYLGPDHYQTFATHRMVLMTFDPIPNPDEMQVNHLNGHKTWNIYLPGSPLHNLEWCTAKENTQHAIQTGLRAPGVPLYERTIPPEKENEIRILCKILQEHSTYTARQIADLLNINFTQAFGDLISDLRTGDRWAVITKEYNLSPRIVRYDDETVHKICHMIEQNYATKDIAKELNVEYNNTFVKRISSIKHGTSQYKEITSQYNFS